jgi:hypothetical protein
MPIRHQDAGEHADGDTNADRKQDREDRTAERGEHRIRPTTMKATAIQMRYHAAMKSVMTMPRARK